MGLYYNQETDTINPVSTVFTVVIVIVALVASIMIGLPLYGIWQSEQSGRAKLAEAQFSKQVKFEEAKANLVSQELNAKAEVIRAKGASQAIEIESGKLTENYIRYLWVQQQDNLNDKTVIYIPTEAGLPITEAPRVK